MGRKKDFDDFDDVDLDGLDDDFPEKKEGFFSRMFKKKEIDPDFDDDLDDGPVFEKKSPPPAPAAVDDDVFDLSAAAPSAPVFNIPPPPAMPAVPPQMPPEPVFNIPATPPPAMPSAPVFNIPATPPPAMPPAPVFNVPAASPPPIQPAPAFNVPAPPRLPSPPPPPPPPPALNRIAHVCLYVRNLEASIAFYTKLGFRRRFAFNKDGNLFGVYLELGNGSFLELFEDANYAGAANGRLAHFCLETPDIDAAARSLSALGIAHTPKKLGSDSTYQIWLKDPDGNDFEIHQYTPTSSQIIGGDVEADW